MEWTTPTYAEIKMDAEIGSYQEDRDETPECPFVSNGTGAGEPADAAVAG